MGETNDRTIEEYEKKVFDTYEELATKVISYGYRHNPIYVARKAIVDWALLTEIDIRDKRVLNVGCFEPIDELVWAGVVKKWVAIDINPTSIKVAEQILYAELSPELARRVKFKTMDARSLVFEDGEFDVAVSFSVIDHIPDPRARDDVIIEMARVVKRGSYVIITVPNRYGYYHIMYDRNQRRGIKTDVGYQYFYSYFELRRKLTKSGLKPLKFTSDMKNVAHLPRFVRAFTMPFIFFGNRMGFLAQKI